MSFSLFATDAFSGLSGTANWTLDVSGGAQGQTGTLVAWTLGLGPKRLRPRQAVHACRFDQNPSFQQGADRLLLIDWQIAEIDDFLRCWW